MVAVGGVGEGDGGGGFHSSASDSDFPEGGEDGREDCCLGQREEAVLFVVVFVML